MNEYESMTRGEEAKNILDSPIFIESMTALRNGIAQQWVESGGDSGIGEKLHLMYVLTYKFEEAFNLMIQDGLYSKQKLEEEDLVDATRQINQSNGNPSGIL